MAAAEEDSSTRLQDYKHKSIQVDKGRKKRVEETIQLRKSKRDEQFLKRRNISKFDYNQEGFLSKVTSVETLSKYLLSSDEDEVLMTLLRFRQLLSSDEMLPIDETLSYGCLPKFIELLTIPHHQMQLESSWIITNIASGSSSHTEAVVKAGAIPPLVQLLLCDDAAVCDQAIWALGNIAGDKPEFRDLLLNYGIMNPLLKVLSSDALSKKNASWTLSNLCRGKHPLPNFQNVLPALQILPKLLLGDESDVLKNSLWALAFLADGPNDRIQQVIQSGICSRLCQILMLSKNPDIISPALRAAGNILTGDDRQTQAMLNSSILPAMKNILESFDGNFSKEVCWAVSNITAGNKFQIQEVIESNIFPNLIDVLNSTSDYKIRKEAAWAVLNATSGGTDEQIRYLVSIGCIQPLCNLLTVLDFKVVLVTLEGLDNILKVGDNHSFLIEEAKGLDRMEYLQVNCTNDKICRLCVRIIDRYFCSDND